MSPIAKNLLIVLGIISVVFAGYYLLSQGNSTLIRSSESNDQLALMLVRTQEFVTHRQILDAILLDTSIFQSEEFLALRSFSPKPNQFEVGRSNPFVPTQPERPLVPITATSVSEVDLE